jgi:thiol:disulfide interchange protein
VFEVRVDATPAEHWHIYGLNSPNGESTKLALTFPAGATLGSVHETEPKQEKVEFFGPVTSHYGKATFTQAMRAPEKAGTYTINGKLSWQACDPKTCVSESRSFSLTLTVAADAAPTGINDPSASDGAVSKTTPTTDPATTPGASPTPSAPESERSWATLIFASFLLGLGMLLMPCTYPMIPITISVFSKGESASKAATVLRAAVYAGGIVISFLVVGGVVQVLVGGQGQAAINAFATNAWVNLVIGVIFVYFAFSFFGFYELGLPAPLQRLMQAGTAKTGSDGTVPTWSLFLMGLFFVLTSYTCGAPVVLSLFVTAASDPHAMSVLVATFVFACTVALPFFGLALVPNAMKLMPRSGAWFTVFKVVLGLVELGFAVKFFRGVDIQWGELDLLTRPVTLGLWIALCVVGSLYLVGRLPWSFPHDPPLRPASGQRIFWAVAVLGLGGYFGYGLAGNDLSPAVEAFILAKEEKGDEEGTIKFTAEGVSFAIDLESLEKAKQEVGPEGRAFLMFTGHNCVNCVQMEKGILPQPKVKELLARVPRIALFTDKGEIEAQHRNMMVEKYNRAGAIPAFFVINGKGEVLSAQVGNCDEADFLEFLSKGGLE